MKETIRKPADSRPAEPSSDSGRQSAAGTPVTQVDGLASQLAAIEAEKRALLEKEARVRKAMWDDGISRIKAAIQQLIAGGHESAQIAKALGFHNRQASAPASASTPTKGPTTNAGWFQTYRSRAIQVYVKAHPDLAASLKSKAVAPADYPTHIPADDLKAIDAQAQVKANAKSPSTPTSA